MGSNREAAMVKIRNELAQLHKLADNSQLAKAIGSAFEEADRLVEQAYDEQRKPKPL